jgi:hypothetical protein
MMSGRNSTTSYFHDFAIRLRVAEVHTTQGISPDWGALISVQGGTITVRHKTYPNYETAI